MEHADSKSLEGFGLNYTNQYRDVLAQQMRDAYEFGKKSAADEIGVEAPASRRAVVALINQTAQTITDKQMSDLLFLVKSQALGQLRTNQLSDVTLGLTDLLASISTAFQQFFDTKMPATASLVVMQNANRGRDDVFAANRNDIYAYQWSARLENSCPICRDLDGTVMDYEQLQASKWRPPVHFHCFCILVAILKSETNLPAITGLPDAPGGVTGPAL